MIILTWYNWSVRKQLMLNGREMFFIIVKSACEINYCRSFHYNSNAVHARRLQCSHQPISNWHQEHFDHHQHGVAELLQWAAQEEARRGWWLRCFMMEKNKYYRSKPAFSSLRSLFRLEDNQLTETQVLLQQREAAVAFQQETESITLSEGFSACANKH